MGDMLESGQAWLVRQRKRHMTREVTYVRGLARATVQATVGRTTFQIDRGDGVLIESQSRDYLIDAADLVLDDARTLPLAGDRIEEAAGEQTFVYEVMAPGEAPPWRYSDPYRLLLRIHTKEVGASE